MIKNQLYPYIEKYINEYLHGFSKEQLNIGVVNGQISLDGINIKPDRLNEKLDSLEVPIWLKAGIIKKIKVGCSLMNFIGEKPLEVLIESIECIVTPSFKWIIKNLPTYIEENEFHIKETYDAMDNNSHDIFNRKVNIYDSSIIRRKQKIYELFTDKSKISEIVNTIFTQCLKFYYQKPYLINIKVKNVHIRFEDDQLLNYHSDIGLGVKLGNLEINLSADGVAKKNTFKLENLNFYWEPKPTMLVPSKNFLESLDKDSNIGEKYYEYLKTLNFDNTKSCKQILIVENFNCMGNLGIQLIESGNLDFFAKNREKNYKCFLQLATSEINFNIYPDLLIIFERVADFMKTFFIIEPIQDFKPMRKPYNCLSQLVRKYKNEPVFMNKRKMVTRDWFYYLIWTNRFKKAIYGKAFNSQLHSEFCKYFNICCLGTSDMENKNEINNINDSYFKKGGDPNNSIIGVDDIKHIKENEENLNPDNINLTVVSEILIKGLNIYFHSDIKLNKTDYILIKLIGLDNKNMINKDKFEMSLEIRNFSISCKNKITVIKSGELDNSSNNYDIQDKLSKNANLIEDSFSSEIGLVCAPSHVTDNSHISNSSMFSGSNINNSKINKKLTILNEALNNVSKKGKEKESISILSKSKAILVNPPKKINFVNFILDEDQDFASHNNDLNQFSSKNLNLSKIINEYNKNMIKEKKIVVKADTGKIIKNIIDTKNSKTTIDNKKPITKVEEKVMLDLFEIVPTQTKSSSYSFSMKFLKINSKISENLNINIGSLRLNAVPEYINSSIYLISDYPINKSLMMENNFNDVSDLFINLKNQKQLYELKKLIMEKLTKNSNKNKIKTQQLLPISNLKIQNDETAEYTSYLKRDLQSYDSNFFTKNSNFEVNYLMNSFYKKNVELNINYSNFYCFIYNSNINNNEEINFANGNNILAKLKFPNLNFKFLLQNNTINLKLFEIELNINELNSFRDIIANIIVICKEKFNENIKYIQPMLKKVLDDNNTKKNNNEAKCKILSASVIPDNQMKKNSIAPVGLNSILQNNILNDKAFIKDKSNIIKIEDGSRTASNNTSYMDIINLPTITDGKNKELKNVSSNNKNINIFSESEIERGDKSFENISDLEDYGITIEKPKKINEDIKNIQGFTRLESEKTDESQIKKKNAEITASGNGPLKLKLKNSGNINSMNINIK